MKRSIKRITNHAEESEKSLEKYLVEAVDRLGGIALKYSSMTQGGYPDRVCLLPFGVTVWVEVKSKGEQPRAIQEMRIKEILRLGHKAAVCDSKEKIDEILNAYRREI